MLYCPFCGHILDAPLANGISSCSNCNRLFDSSINNRLLSAAWHVRRRNVTLDELQHFDFLTQDQIEFIEDYVIEAGYTHDELIRFINNKVA